MFLQVFPSQHWLSGQHPCGLSPSGGCHFVSFIKCKSVLLVNIQSPLGVQIMFVSVPVSFAPCSGVPHNPLVVGVIPVPWNCVCASVVLIPGGAQM